MHELGHALAAKTMEYKQETSLLPIGGLARLELPENQQRN
jgi:hypothetical protein